MQCHALKIIKHWMSLIGTIDLQFDGSREELNQKRHRWSSCFHDWLHRNILCNMTQLIKQTERKKIYMIVQSWSICVGEDLRDIQRLKTNKKKHFPSSSVIACSLFESNDCKYGEDHARIAIEGWSGPMRNLHEAESFWGQHALRVANISRWLTNLFSLCMW